MYPMCFQPRNTFSPSRVVCFCFGFVFIFRDPDARTYFTQRSPFLAQLRGVSASRLLHARASAGGSGGPAPQPVPTSSVLCNDGHRAARSHRDTPAPCKPVTDPDSWVCRLRLRSHIHRKQLTGLCCSRKPAS